jgi:creatinine amidohydrolase
MMERRMEYLKPAEYRELRSQAPIAYLPWGAHEWHGVHNPLGTDAIKAHRLCMELAEQTGGVVFPPVYCGYGTMLRHGQTCNLEFPIELVETTARTYFLGLAMEGWHVIVVMMGHYGWDHVCAIRRQARMFQEDNARRIRVIAEPDYVWTSPELPGDHAAANETSYMMHFFPDLVDLSRLPSAADVPELGIRREGVGGIDPRREASADRGRRQIELLLSRAVPQIRAALAEVWTPGAHAP